MYRRMQILQTEALTEEEAGITDSTSGEQDKSQQSDADVQNETTPSEDTETQEEQNSSGRNRRKSAGKEVELKRTTGLLSDSEEPEGELLIMMPFPRLIRQGTSSIQPFMEVMSELIRMRMEIPSWLIIHL